ncbi:hypothetical protein PZN02_006274 (plasmid) [Sinorhizobium garamanticum]|uniref:Uncharacterized protein n=1 Tax=Sinorhizobium garamanticum TaxID=680247 RepID=A0ABY8DKR2_9HYPH|nr:hypothetical protein PZN02_006274 [Sinorhizobium garamanticum]
MRGAFLNSLMMTIVLATVPTMTAFAQPQMTTVAKAIDSNPDKPPEDAADPRAYPEKIDLALTIAAEDVVYMPSYVIRCPQRLPVTFRPSIA